MINLCVKWILILVIRVWIFQAHVNATEKSSNKTLLSDLKLKSSNRSLPEVNSFRSNVISEKITRPDGNVSYNETHSGISTTYFTLTGWFTSENKKVANLALIPILAFIFFITIIVMRICRWSREDQKFKERGCSYDITSYVILTEGDKNFLKLDLSSEYDTVSSDTSLLGKSNTYSSRHISSPLIKLPTSVLRNSSYFFGYDTVTSQRSLQFRIDSQIHDTVRSYNSFLRNSLKKKVYESQLSQDGSKEENKTKGNRTEDSDHVPPLRKIPGTRFSIVPALDNYVRLKRVGLQRSVSQPTSPVVKRKGSPTSSDVTPLPKSPFKQKVSFRDKHGQFQSRKAENHTVELVDAAVQVTLQRPSGRKGKKKKNYLTKPYSIEMQEIKPNIANVQQCEKDENSQVAYNPRCNAGNLQNEQCLNFNNARHVSKVTDPSTSLHHAFDDGRNNDDVIYKELDHTNNVVVFADVHCCNENGMVLESAENIMNCKHYRDNSIKQTCVTCVPNKRNMSSNVFLSQYPQTSEVNYSQVLPHPTIEESKISKGGNPHSLERTRVSSSQMLTLRSPAESTLYNDPYKDLSSCPQNTGEKYSHLSNPETTVQNNKLDDSSRCRQTAKGKCSEVLPHPSIMTTTVYDNHNCSEHQDDKEHMSPLLENGHSRYTCSQNKLCVKHIDRQRTKSENDLPTVNNNYIDVYQPPCQKHFEMIRTHAKLHTSRVSPVDMYSCICQNDKKHQCRKYSLGAINDEQSHRIDRFTKMSSSFKDLIASSLRRSKPEVV